MEFKPRSLNDSLNVNSSDDDYDINLSELILEPSEIKNRQTGNYDGLEESEVFKECKRKTRLSIPLRDKLTFNPSSDSALNFQQISLFKFDHTKLFFFIKNSEIP